MVLCSLNGLKTLKKWITKWVNKELFIIVNLQRHYFTTASTPLTQLYLLESAWALPDSLMSSFCLATVQLWTIWDTGVARQREQLYYFKLESINWSTVRYSKTFLFSSWSRFANFTKQFFTSRILSSFLSIKFIDFVNNIINLK